MEGKWTHGGTAAEEVGIESAESELRRILGHFATGADAAGKSKGFIANAFSSVSLDPPLVLVCPDRRSGALPDLRRETRF